MEDKAGFDCLIGRVGKSGGDDKNYYIANCFNQCFSARLMRSVQQTPKHELVAACLRDGLYEGRWSGSLPGVLRLAAELDVSPFTVRRALRQLEAESLLTGCGLGRSRSIAAPGRAKASPRRLRVVILRHNAHLADNPQTSLVLNS